MAEENPGRKAGASRRATRPLDAIDHTILDLLQDDAGRTDADLARRVELSASGLKKRLRKLEERGVIKRRVTLLDRNAVGLGLLAFVQVTLMHHQKDAVRCFADSVLELPEVLECHFLTGENDYLLKVVARDHSHLGHILGHKLAAIPTVDRLRTSIVLNEIKQTTALPLPGRPDAEEGDK